MLGLAAWAAFGLAGAEPARAARSAGAPEHSGPTHARSAETGWRATLTAAHQGHRALQGELERAHRALERRLTDEGLEALLVRLAPPTRRPAGYGVLPEISEDTEPRSVELGTRRYSLGWLRDALTRALPDARALRQEIEQAAGTELPALLDRFDTLRARHRQLREHIRYHELWQPDVEGRPDFYRARSELAAQARRLRELLSSGGDPAEERALRQRLLHAVAPFQATPSVAIQQQGYAIHVLPVPLTTDIEDASFLARVERAVEATFNEALSSRAHGLRIDVQWIRLPPERLYAGSPPPPGSSLDAPSHLARFPAGSLVLTTGAQSTHAYVGRSIQLGPERIAPRVLAHEFAHLLGFSDAYLRTVEGKPGDPDGVVLVEWVGLRDDLMGNPGAGAVSDAMVEQLLRAYGSFRSSRQRPIEPHMGISRSEPIHSEFARDPDVEERLDAFLVGLGERIDMIQEADRAGDLKGGAERLHELAREARELGFPPLEAAATLAAECCEEGHAGRAHARILGLTEVVQRVRLGHRGAL